MPEEEQPKTEKQAKAKEEKPTRNYGEELSAKGYHSYFWVAKPEDLSDPKQPDIITVGYRDPVKGIIAIAMPREQKLIEAEFILKKYGKK